MHTETRHGEGAQDAATKRIPKRGKRARLKRVVFITKRTQTINALLMRALWGFMVFGIFLGSASATWACPKCRPLVRAGVYNHDFAANFLVLLLPVAVVLLLSGGIHFSDAVLVRGSGKPRHD